MVTLKSTTAGIDRLSGFTVTIFSIISLISGLLLAFEWLYGNGDGLWRDIDIRHFTFHTLFLTSFIFAGVVSVRLGPAWWRMTLYTIMTVIVLIASIEMTCRLTIACTSQNHTAVHPSFKRLDWLNAAEPDGILGLKARANRVFNWTPIKENIRYPVIHISTDSLSRRVTPRAGKAIGPQYALFLGCSYTYGDGVSDDQTLPYYFQCEAPEYESYNYGFLAYSPLHMLTRLQQTPIREQIPQQNGIAVFTLINDHLDRIIPTSRWIEMTRGKFPYLEENTMRTEGTFDVRRKLYTQFLLHFQSWGLKQLLHWNYPKHHTQQHEELLVQIIVKSREEYVRRFGNDNFYVVVFPGNPVSPYIKSLLKKANVLFFDYSKTIDMKEHMLGFDNAHPDEHVYEAVAKQLATDLGLKSNR